MTLTKPESLINLQRGWPHPSLFPILPVQNAIQAAFSEEDQTVAPQSLLQYGPDQGYEPLRHKIAEWLTSFYLPRNHITFDRIAITSGASQGLSSILQLFTDPGVTQFIWLVAPTYWLACAIFDQCGFAGRLKAVPEDNQGIDIAFLAEKLAQADYTWSSELGQPPRTKNPKPWSKLYRHVIYTVPTFSNPSGRVMSLARREALVRLARKYDALIIADDVYDMLQWHQDVDHQLNNGHRRRLARPTADLPRLVDVDRFLTSGPIDRFGHAISNGSFSKIVGPGLRTGWVEGTPAFANALSQVGVTGSGGCPSHFTAVIISHMLPEAIDAHLLVVLRSAYTRRYHIVMQAITTYLLPLGVTTPSLVGSEGARGGFYIWLLLPQDVYAEDVISLALNEQNLLLAGGETFWVTGNKLDPKNETLRCLRICIAMAEEDRLVEGIARLELVVRQLMKQDRD